MLPANVIKILKPIGAGLALAFLVTAFVDKPAPVHFQPENPYAAKQAEIVGSQAGVVIERNIMKLGSLLSVSEGDIVIPEHAAAPVAAPAPEQPVAQPAESTPEGTGPEVKGEVAQPPES